MRVVIMRHRWLQQLFLALAATPVPPPPPEPPDPEVPPPEAPVALGLGVETEPSHGSSVLHVEKLLAKPRDWTHGLLQWWAWNKALSSATWMVRGGDFQPGLEAAALLFWRRSPGIVRYAGGAATARGLLVHFKAVRKCIARRNPDAFFRYWEPRLGRYAGVTWPRGAWPGVYLQRTDAEHKWLQRVLLRASRLGRVPRD